MICIRYVRGTTDWNHLPWPGRIVTSCLSYLTGGLVSNVELTGYHQPEVFRKGQKERGDTSPCVLPTSQNHPFWHPSCLTDALATRKDTNKTWDCEPCGRVVLLGSLTLLLSSLEPLPNKVSLPWSPFPIKSLGLSARVSPRTVHFQVLDKSPLSGPGRGPPSCNNSSELILL